MKYADLKTDRLQEAFEYFLSWGRYDLTLVYLGPQMMWQTIRFDIDKGSWYNPDNMYPWSDDPLMAAMLAIEVDEEMGYQPTFGSALGAPE